MKIFTTKTVALSDIEAMALIERHLVTFKQVLDGDKKATTAEIGDMVQAFDDEILSLSPENLTILISQLESRPTLLADKFIGTIREQLVTLTLKKLRA